MRNHTCLRRLLAEIITLSSWHTGDMSPWTTSLTGLAKSVGTMNSIVISSRSRQYLLARSGYNQQCALVRYRRITSSVGCLARLGATKSSQVGHRRCTLYSFQWRLQPVALLSLQWAIQVGISSCEESIALELEVADA